MSERARMGRLGAAGRSTRSIAAEDDIVLAVDERPHIQALERAQGYLKLANGRALIGHGHTYKRHGTTTLFAALNIATGEVQARHYKRRRRREQQVAEQILAQTARQGRQDARQVGLDEEAAADRERAQRLADSKLFLETGIDPTPATAPDVGTQGLPRQAVPPAGDPTTEGIVSTPTAGASPSGIPIPVRGQSSALFITPSKSESICESPQPLSSTVSPSGVDAQLSHPLATPSPSESTNG